MQSVVDRGNSSIRRKLAEAVAAPGWPAILLDKDNHRNGELPVAEAVCTGECFTVRVADHILALDDDHGADGALLVAEAATEFGLNPVVVASGRPGGLHAFIRTSRDDVRGELVGRARACRLNVTKSIRPPLTPHRLPDLSPHLITPEQPEIALAALRGNISHATAAEADIGVEMWTLLVRGELPDRYRKPDGTTNRSDAVQGFLTRAAGLGMMRDEALGLLLDDTHALGDLLREKMRQRGWPGMDRWFDRSWATARQFIEQRPTFGGRNEALQVLRRMDELARRLPWPGTAGGTDRDVLRAHIAIAVDAGTTRYRASERQIAERAGVHLATVRRSNKRLKARGWISIVKPWQTAEIATTWRVRVPADLPDDLLPVSPQGGCEDTGSTSSDPRSDVWRWHGGLGKASERVWDALAVPMSAKDLAAALDLKPDTVSRHLNRLAAYGLAIRDGTSWRRGSTDPGSAAASLRSHGAAQRQRVRHEADRAAYRNALMARIDWSRSRSATNEHEGA